MQVYLDDAFLVSVSSIPIICLCKQLKLPKYVHIDRTLLVCTHLPLSMNESVSSTRNVSVHG